jgi:hypothetical protein
LRRESTEWWVAEEIRCMAEKAGCSDDGQVSMAWDSVI